MANVMLKCVKFAQILNRRLSFSSVKYYRGLYFSRSYSDIKFNKNYATVAYKLDLNEDLRTRNNEGVSRFNGKDNLSIDAALSRIDSLIQRNGRTQLKNVKKIFSSITSKEATSSVHALYLLRACKHCIDEPPSRRVNLVNEIWNRYQELGIEFDVKHYNAMLEVHVKNNPDFNPVDILTSMEELKIEPNKDTYMLIMKKYCQDGNISGASEILEYMKEKQMTADEKVFNYLIEAHINNKDLAGAKEMVEVMKSSNLEPTADTHCILACGYAANGDKEKMMSHLKECKDTDNVGYQLRVIQALVNSGNQQLIDDVISLIECNNWYQQQEIINTAVELIYKNSIEVAYKLVNLSCTPNYYEGANIFIKQLIRTGHETSEIVRYCERIKNEGINQNIHILAAKLYAECDNIGQVVQFFKGIEEMGYNIRPSSFWPLFSSVKENSKEDCWFILKSMTELGILSDFKTYLDVVYPSLGVPTPDEVLRGIKYSGQAADLATDALFVYYCNIGEIDYALELTEKLPITIGSRLDVKKFLKLYEEISPENLPKYYKLFKYIFMECSKFPSKTEVEGELLAELILHKKRLLEILLDKYKDLKFSDYAFLICEQELRARNPSQLATLRKIKALNNERESMVKVENLSDRDEDEYINHLRAEHIPCRSFLAQRINHHIRTKNIVRLQQLLAIFDEMKLEYTPLMLANLFGLWCSASDLDKAKEFLDKLKANYPDFNVDLPKAIDYVSLLVKYEKFDESYEALKEFLSKPHHYGNKDALFKSIRRLNASLSSSHNAEFVRKMQNLMLPLSKDLGSKKSLLDPSVNIHLQRTDLKSALEEFRNIVNTHRVPACLNQFLKKCLNNNEKNILQQVIDLTIKCTSKSYALCELAVAMIETYRTQNAVKVIENLGSEADPVILESICERLCHQNKLSELEEFLKITESLNHIDRESLYRHAFRACANRSDFQRALQLFEKMKTEVIEPHPDTVKLLQKLLKENNQPVPLSLMSRDTSEISSSATEATKTFLGLLEAGNIESALKELSSLKKGFIRTLSIKTLTELVDLCLQKNYTHELSSNVYTMSYILDNAKEVLKPILEKYSLVGDTEKFTLIMGFVPDFTLMNIGFNSYFCRAFISSGKYDALLSLMEERSTHKNKLFSAIAFEELLKLPEYEERIFNLAVKYLDSNYNLPIAVVWANYFSKGNYVKAEEIQKKFPISFERVDNIILRNIKQSENVDLAKKYVDFIKDTNVRSRIKERAYGAAADMLVFKGMYDEATALVVDAESQNLELHKYYLSTLVTLKSILEKDNKPVPFKIPLDESPALDSNLE